MRISIFLLFCLSSFSTLAQDSRAINYGDFTKAIGSPQGSVSLDFFHLWKFGKSKKIEVGIGGRLTSYFGTSILFLSSC